jgi:hypothetical protein
LSIFKRQIHFYALLFIGFSFLTPSIFAEELKDLDIDNVKVPTKSVQKAITMNRQSRLINIPVASMNMPGMFEYFTNIGSYPGNSGFSFGLTYAPVEEIIVGTTLVNFHNLVSNLQVTFFQLDNFFDMTLATGMQGLLTGDNLADWAQYEAFKNNLLSHYIVTRYTYSGFNLHVGIGRKQFDFEKRILSGIGNGLQQAKGLFWGLDFGILEGKGMIEWDSGDLNLGYRYQLDESNEVFVAITEIFHSQSDKAGANQLGRLYTFGFSIKHNRNRILDQEIQTRKARLKKLKASTDTLNKEFDKMDKRFFTNIYNYEQLTDAYGQLSEDYDVLDVNYKVLDNDVQDLEALKLRLATYKTKTADEISQLKERNIHFMLDLHSVSDKYQKIHSKYTVPASTSRSKTDYSKYRKDIKKKIRPIEELEKEKVFRDVVKESQ